MSVKARRIAPLLVTALAVLAILPAVAAASSSTLATYGTLAAGQDIVSPDGHYELVMEADGDLVESIVGGRALWSSNTTGNVGAHAVMQPGGNLVIYDSAGAAVWSSNSSGTGCPVLAIQDDGNVVVYSPRAIWATHRVQSRMRSGDVLRPGWSIYAPNEKFRLTMQADGNLVLRDGAGKALWASATQGHPGAYAVLKHDGNLVVYPPVGAALWSTKTYKDTGARLYLKKDGNLVLDKGSTAVWSTNTYNQGSGGSLAPRRPAPVTSCPAPQSPQPAPAPAPPPAAPVVTTPVTTPIPTPPPHIPRELAVKLKISWTWNHALTWLHRARIGSFPGKSAILVQCHGRHCPGKHDISAHGFWHVLRLLHNLTGNRYHAGERVRIILKAPGFLPERADVMIRDGGLPHIKPLPA